MEKKTITLEKTEWFEMPRLRRLYRTAFPRCERKPFAMIRRMCKAGRAEVLSIREAGSFCGLVIAVQHRDLVLIDYLAIAPNRRGGGLGSAALRLIAQRYAGRRVFLEIERPDPTAQNNAERQRRKRFYLQNGLCEDGVTVRLFGVEMELLCFTQTITFAEYFDLYRNMVGAALANKNVILLEK